MKKIFISFITIGGIACASFAGDAVTFSKLSAGGSGGSQNNTTTSNQQPTILYGGVTHNENKSQYEEITAENLNVKILELIMTGEVSGNVEPTTVEKPKTTDKDLGDFVPASKPGSNNGNYPGDFVPTSDVKLPGGISDKTPPLPEKTTDTGKKILDYLEQIQKNIPKLSGTDNNTSNKTDSDSKQSAGTNSTPPEDNSVTTTDSDPEWVAKLGEKITECTQKIDELVNKLDQATAGYDSIDKIISGLLSRAGDISTAVDAFIDFFLYPTEVIESLNSKVDELKKLLRDSDVPAGKIKKRIRQLEKNIEQFKKASQIAKNKFNKLAPLGNVGTAIDAAKIANEIRLAHKEKCDGIIYGDLETYIKGYQRELDIVPDYIANSIDDTLLFMTTVKELQNVFEGKEIGKAQDFYKNNKIKQAWEDLKQKAHEQGRKDAEAEYNRERDYYRKNIEPYKKDTYLPAQTKVSTERLKSIPMEIRARTPEIRSARPMEIRAPKNTRTVPRTGEIRKNNE